MIAGGRVSVNGTLVTELGSRADPERDEIAVDGVSIQPDRQRVYILLNKPPGYTSTRFDRFAKHTVVELVSEIGGYLYPVGRLDVDTSGAIILTNDGEFANLLTHPSHEIEKTYLAEVKGRVREEAIARLESGVELDDGRTAPARARLVSYSRDTNMSNVELTIHEGRKRQVKRMMEAVGHRVVHLARLRIGNLDVAGLPEGKHRFLTDDEIAELKELAAKEQ